MTHKIKEKLRKREVTTFWRLNMGVVEQIVLWQIQATNRCVILMFLVWLNISYFAQRYYLNMNPIYPFPLYSISTWK